MTTVIGWPRPVNPVPRVCLCARVAVCSLRYVKKRSEPGEHNTTHPKRAKRQKLNQKFTAGKLTPGAAGSVFFWSPKEKRKGWKEFSKTVPYQRLVLLLLNVFRLRLLLAVCWQNATERCRTSCSSLRAFPMFHLVPEMFASSQHTHTHHSTP